MNYTDNHIAELSSELVVRAQSGEQAALVELIERFRPLARSIASAKMSNALPYEDATSLCIETFIRTLPGYKAELGHLPSYWNAKARQAIVDYYRSIAAVGRNNGQLAVAFHAEMAEARANTGRSYIDIADFAKRHDVTVSRARRVALAGGMPISLDTPGETGSSVADTLIAEDESPAAVAERTSSLTFIQEKLATLNANERNVVERYFGLNGYNAESFQSIGVAIGVTMQRAQQILTSAIETMRVRSSRMDKLALPVAKKPAARASAADELDEASAGKPAKKRGRKRKAHAETLPLALFAA